MVLTIEAYGQTDIGLVRHNNEDYWDEVPDLQFYVLADGMGGHLAGEVASRKSVETLCQLLTKKTRESEPLSLSKIQANMKSALADVNRLIYQMSRQDEHLRGMGTTVCCVQFHAQGVVYGHVGDSRIYRLRKKKLTQLTTDHSLLRELIDLGQLDEHHVPEFLYKNILTKAIGAEVEVDSSIKTTDVLKGDIYLMCTDGLTDLLTQDNIETILNASTTIQKSGKTLVQTAKERGGYDNITVVLMHVKDVHE